MGQTTKTTTTAKPKGQTRAEAIRSSWGKGFQCGQLTEVTNARFQLPSGVCEEMEWTNLLMSDCRREGRLAERDRWVHKGFFARLRYLINPNSIS